MSAVSSSMFGSCADLDCSEHLPAQPCLLCLIPALWLLGNRRSHLTRLLQPHTPTTWPRPVTTSTGLMVQVPDGGSLKSTTHLSAFQAADLTHSRRLDYIGLHNSLFRTTNERYGQRLPLEQVSCCPGFTSIP